MENVSENKIKNLFSEYLKTNEDIVWVGYPKHMKIFTPIEFVLLPFQLIVYLMLIGSIVIFNFYNIEASRFKANLPFSAFFISILIYNGYFTFLGRFLRKRHRKNHSFYAITNRRVMILIKGKTNHLQEILLSDLEKIEKIVNRDGTGSIIFGKLNLNIRMNLYTQFLKTQKFYEAYPVFQGIEHVESVYKKVQGLMT